MIEKWFERRGLYTRRDKLKMTALILFLLIGLGIFGGIILAGVTNASAATISETEQINITIVTVENSSVNTIMVGGLLYACSGGECVAYATFDYDCPSCPTCPVVDFTTLEGNITTALEGVFKAHNSTTLNEEDKDWLKDKLRGETIAGVKAEIQEVMEKTILKRQADYNNLTKKNEGLQEDIYRLRNNVSDLLNENTRLADKVDDEEDRVEDLRGDATLLGVIIAIILGVLMYSYLHQKGMLQGWATRVKQGSGGLTPEQERMAAADERKKEAKIATAVALSEREAEEAEDTLRAVQNQNQPARQRDATGFEKEGVKATHITEESLRAVNPRLLQPKRRDRMEELITCLLEKDGYAFAPTEIYAMYPDLAEGTVDSYLLDARRWIEMNRHGHFVSNEGEWSFVAEGE